MNERRATILNLVAESYISTAHPVPSSRIAELLDLSSATVRNEFSALEEGGFLQQPHTSAGRIPTASGFRAYARAFLPPQDLPPRQRRLLLHQLAAAHGEGLLEAIARAGAELSGYAVVVSLPADARLRTLEIHLSLLSSRRLLAVVVLENGLVRQLAVDLDPAPSDEVIDDAERNLRQLTLPVEQVPRALRAIAGREQEELARTLRAVADAWPHLNPPRLVSDGLKNLFAEPESRDPDFLRLVVEQVELPTPPSEADERLRLNLDDALARISARLRLGGDFGDNDSDGTLTLLGPARMRYPVALMVARGVSEAVASRFGTSPADPEAA